MRIELRVIAASLLVLGLILVCIAAIGILAAVSAPVLGLGEAEHFVLYKAWGMSRIDTMIRGLQVLVLGAGLCAINLLYRYDRLRARLNEILSEEPHSPSRSLVKALAVAAVKTGPAINRAWGFLNRDWGATFILFPFAFYVVAFALYVLPETPWVYPDTNSYAKFYPLRTLFYPLFLRVAALLSDDPVILILPPLLAGIIGTIFFAEVVQRIFRNVLIAVFVGVTLLFTWPLLSSAVSLLADYWFYVFLTYALAFVLLAMDTQKPRWLFLLAVFGGFAVWVRPLGIIVFLAFPFFLILYPRLWRRTVVYMGLPLAIICLSQMALNWFFLDVFALSKIRGWGPSANTALLLRVDTPTRYPELRDRLHSMAEPYRHALKQETTNAGRLSRIYEATNPLMNRSLDVVYAYGMEKGIIDYQDLRKLDELRDFLNGLSPLNRILGKEAIERNRRELSLSPLDWGWSSWDWAWIDDTLYEIGRAAHFHNLGGLIEMMAVKLPHSWKHQLPTFFVWDDFGVFSRFDPNDPGLGAAKPVAVMQAAREDLFPLTVSMFNRVVKTVRGPYYTLPVPGTVLVVILIAVAATVTGLIRRGPVNSRFASLAYLGCFLVCYHVVVCIGQIPITRFLMVASTASATLYAAPLYIIPTAARWLWRRYSMHLNLGSDAVGT